MTRLDEIKRDLDDLFERKSREWSDANLALHRKIGEAEGGNIIASIWGGLVGVLIGSLIAIFVIVLHP